MLLCFCAHTHIPSSSYATSRHVPKLTAFVKRSCAEERRESALTYLVALGGGADPDRLDEDEDVEELGADHAGAEGRVPVLEDEGHLVVADVPLLLQLLAVGVRVGQQGRHVEHQLRVVVHLVHRLLAAARLDVQAPAKPSVCTHWNNGKDFGAPTIACS